MSKRIAALLVAVAGAALAQLPPRDRLVIVASIDGFALNALNDPNTSAPAVRKLISSGVVARGGMIPVNPTVTWPNHTAIVTGVNASRHGLLYNGLPVRTPGKAVRVDPFVPRDKLVLVPTVYDLAHNAGLKTAEVDWVAIEDAPTIDFSFPEIPKADGAVVREMVAAGLVTADRIRDFRKLSINVRDDVWTEAAMHILRRHRPNLLLYHLLTTDSVQHRYGTGALAAQTALALADRQLARLLDTVKELGMENRTTVLVVSDHGFHNVKRVIHANVLLKGAGLIRGENCDAWVIPEGGTAMVYITTEARRAELLPKLRAMFTGVEGVDRILDAGQFAEFGFPPPGPESRMADFVLAAKEGYGFGGAQDGAVVVDVPPSGNIGNHGYLNSMADMRAVFIASGAGIRAGAPLAEVRNLDIAPTIARLLGLPDMKNISGQVIASILK